jgi:hypothetical protein
MALYRDHFGYVDLPDPDAFVPEPDEAPREITLRLPPALKSSVERAAAREGVPADSWLLMTIASSIGSATPKAA